MKIQLQTPQLTIFESALFRTTSTVIQTDDFVLIIDPNWLPIEIQAIRDFVDKIKGNKPIFLFFTHSDYDHIIGYNAFPEAKTIASKAFVENPDKAKILQQINDFDDENYVKRPYEVVYPTIDYVVENDGQIFSIGDTKIQFFNAFGHNADGLFLWIESLGILVVGDYLSNIEFPYIYHSATLYLQTLQTAERLINTENIKYLIPGHGDFTTVIEEMEKRVAESYEYIFLTINSIKSGQDFDMNWLWQRYDFPKVMTRFHSGNMKILKKEL